MSKVLCFGEMLLRFSPQLGGQWLREHQMPFYVGGAELNVATALSIWGQPVAYVTVLPDNYLSKEILHSLSAIKIDISKVLIAGSRVGTYYLPQGADLKHAGVIYDRAGSSFSELKPGQVDWEQVLRDVSWFHFSAISPALHPNLALVCSEALEAAAKKDITISVDLNYRAKLWQYGKTPVEVMPDLVKHCHVIMGNVWAAEKMLGIPVDNKEMKGKKDFLEQAAKTSSAIMHSFTKCRQVANTFRFDQGEGIHYYATLSTNEELVCSMEHETSAIVDKVGSGDTFMAGLIYGALNKLSSQEKIDFAAAAAFGKLFIRGDATTASVEEIKKGMTNYA